MFDLICFRKPIPFFAWVTPGRGDYERAQHFAKLNTSLMVITRKVGCIQTTWLVDEFLSKLMKHILAAAEAEREIELVHIYKRTHARSGALLKFQVFWSDALFQRSPADILPRAQSTYSQNSLEREANQILQISYKKRASFDAFEFTHRGSVCLNFRIRTRESHPV